MAKLNPPFEEFTVSKYSNPELVAKSDPNQAANMIEGVCAGKVGTCGTEYEPNKTKMAAQNQAFSVANYSNPELVAKSDPNQAANMIEGVCAGKVGTCVLKKAVSSTTTDKKKDSDSDDDDEKEESKTATTTVHEKFTGEKNKILTHWITASVFLIVGLFMLWQRKSVLNLLNGKNSKLGGTLIFVPLLIGIVLLVLFSLETFIGVEIFKNDAQILFTIAIIVIPILFLIHQYDECLKKGAKKEQPSSSEKKRLEDRRRDRELDYLRGFEREMRRRDERRRWDRDRRVRFFDDY
jgi:hypothetical protein